MPRRNVDCRGCVFFRFPEELDEDLMKWCIRWVKEHRPGQKLLGYCTLYRRPITYYRGPCNGYKPTSLLSPTKKPITYYLEGKG